MNVKENFSQNIFLLTLSNFHSKSFLKVKKAQKYAHIYTKWPMIIAT